MTETLTHKICKACHRDLPIIAFEKNQHNKDNVIVRRSECKECRNKAKKHPRINAKAKREFELNNPRPEIGSQFHCPVCQKTTTVTKGRDVVLEHCHHTGTIRGYLCNRCNTGIGVLNDDENILKRAIRWIQGKLGIL